MLVPYDTVHMVTNVNPSHYRQVCQRRPWLWSARGWENCTRQDSEGGFHDWSVELSSPRGLWRQTAVAWTGRIPKLTGVGCRSARWYTNPSYTMWASRGQQIDAPSPSPDARGTTTSGMACTHTYKVSTEGIGSWSWRSTPNPYPGVRNLGAKSQQGG